MAERVSLPNGLIKLWWVAFGLGGALVLEQVWEKTFLTWSNGPQMVGFTLLHAYPVVAIVGIIGYYLLFVWLLLVGAFLVRRKALPIAVHIPYLLLPLAVIGLNQVPYAFWAGIGGVHI